MSEQLPCRECGEVREMIRKGENSVGRTVWQCPDGHQQAGPEVLAA